MAAFARDIRQRRASASRPAFRGLAPAMTAEPFIKMFDRPREDVSIIVEHNLDLVLALSDRVFTLARGAVFHRGPAGPLLRDLAYRKGILWL
jgi:ABC-type branched-subunit amino acid transport system ATPase component